MPSRSMDFDGMYNLSVVSGQTIEIDFNTPQTQKV